MNKSPAYDPCACAAVDTAPASLDPRAHEAPRENVAPAGSPALDTSHSVVGRRGSETVADLACACETIALLAAEEAHALDAGDPQRVALARRAEREFLRDRLVHLTLHPAERLGRSDPAGFYRGMSRLLRAFVEWDCNRDETPWSRPCSEPRRQFPREPL